MAITAKENPRYYSGPLLCLDQRLAKDSQTWKAGQWAVLASTGKVAPMATGATGIYGIFGDSQPTATSTSTVKVWKITSAETSFVGYTSKGANDEAAALLRNGASATVGSNILTINDTTATQLFKVVDVMWDKEPLKNKSTDNPGQCIFKALSDAVIQG